jgi:uncharacterized membrane protein
MNMSPFVILAAIAAIGSAAMGGLFYAWSTFAMRGLNRTDPVNAITAMRGINAEAKANPPFALLFLGSTLLALVVGVIAVIQIPQPGSVWLIAGAVLPTVGLITTFAFNVPLNNHLDAVNPAGLSASDAAREWQAFLTRWTAWNHVRTATGFVGAALMLIGLLYR